jgi:hypothetical protein
MAWPPQHQQGAPPDRPYTRLDYSSRKLDGPRLQSVVDRLILQVHDVLFSSEPQAIAIDISRIKNIVSNLGFLLELITERERPDVSIPDQIILVEAGAIPAIANIKWL